MSASEPRPRSRSPRGSAAETEENGAEAPATAPASQVPAHWLAAAAPTPIEAAAGESTAASANGRERSAKGKGKKGKAGGNPAAMFSSSEDKETGEAPTVSAAELLAMAGRLEAGGADAEAAATPAQMAQLFRQAASRMAALEKTAGELKQVLTTVNSLTGRALVGGNVRSDFTDEIVVQGEDSGKSYLIKKGDEEMQEAHRAAAQMRPSCTSGSGSLSVEAKTKEEMDQARQARLERLEAQQASKKKEQEDNAAKSRAREAMFERQFVGAAKPLGTF
mmetsp:Transcript_29287/g.66142  ORF Transcript_29287/g.66142 Transcript_29287/m.66142 type:complete len:278 (+) Transcript_29287:77-910(+)